MKIILAHDEKGRQTVSIDTGQIDVNGAPIMKTFSNWCGWGPPIMEGVDCAANLVRVLIHEKYLDKDLNGEQISNVCKNFHELKPNRDYVINESALRKWSQL